MTESPTGSASIGQAATESSTPLWHQLVVDRWGDGRAATLAAVAVSVVAVALGVYQLYTAIALELDAYIQRVLHLLFVLVLVFLIRPAGNGSWARSLPMTVVDLTLIGVGVVVSLYPVINFDELAVRTGSPTNTDVAMGAVTIVLLLEACRRVIGWFMTVLVACFLFYAWIGPMLPGQLWHRGHTYERISYHTYLQEGIYGLPLGVAATVVFMFIFFGAVLLKTGAGTFFIDLAYAITGKQRGGPAKGAVTASAFMGSLSGSAIANTATTGVFTIPMMKRVGYKPHDAGGVEAAASTGGQLLPPIMGAGAFIMAERLGIPYIEIVKVAIIPALMYFAVVFLFVDILARRHGIHGIPQAELPRLRATLVRGFHFLIPLVVLIYMLIQLYSPLRAGLVATVLLAAVAMVRAHSRMNSRDLLEVFLVAARNTVTVSVATAVAGIIVGVVGLTGLGLKFSSLALSLGQGYLLPTLLLIAIASLILGLGLPVTASYIVLVTLAGPVLGEEFGMAAIVAHMIVYWYSQDSNVTPPIALAAFTASGIAGSKPMRTGLSSWKFAKGLYIIPLMMAYSPLLLNGPVVEVVFAVASGLVGLMTFAVAIEGHWLRPTSWLERIGMALATVLLISPDHLAGAAGAVIAGAVVVTQIRLPRPAEGSRG